MKVIFLDIDGVLNNQSQIVKLVELLGQEQYLEILHEIQEIPFDYRSCKLLQELVKETDAEIILSSTWRLNPKGIESIEKYARIKIKDKTPRLNDIRGKEIKQYLEEHKEITRYVILDDDTDMLEEQRQYFIKVNPIFGFTKTEYIQCRNILNYKFERIDE